MPTIVTASSVGTPTLQADSISDQAGSGSPTFPNGLNISGQNRLADGTVSVPSIAFTNSTTTGLFRKAADSVGFSAAGVEIGFYTNIGAWTFGPSSGFAGVLSHSFRGGVALEGNIAGTEYAANKFIMDTFQGGTRFFSCGGAPGPGNRGYFNWALLDSAGANALDVLACSGVGAWGVGPPGFTGTHTLRGGVTTGELRLGATSVGGGTYNNFSTANIGVILGVTGGCDFTGFANGATGKVLYIGVSNGGITLLHNSAASSVGNRIITLTGANLFRGNGGFTLVYDDNNSRWVQTG